MSISTSYQLLLYEATPATLFHCLYICSVNCVCIAIYLLSEASPKTFAKKDISMPLKMTHIYD